MPEKRRTRHPSSWMPFGSGPRSCAGLRFALLQLKMVVAKVLRDFDFHPSGCDNLTLKEGATILPAEGVRLATFRRSSAMSEAGLRRGSILTGIPLSEWTSMRRTSRSVDNSAGDMAGDDSEEVSFSSSRRGSLVERMDNHQHRPDVQSRGNTSRRNSILEHELMNEGIDLIRRTSINKGREIITLESIHKGIHLHPKTSSTEDQNLLNKAATDISFKTELLKPAFTLAENDIDVKMGVCNMPEDILGDLPGLMSRHVLRRGSAVPELQSVGEETATTEDFGTRGYIAGYTSDTPDQHGLKETATTEDFGTRGYIAGYTSGTLDQHGLQETATTEDFGTRGYIAGYTSDTPDQHKEIMKLRGRLYQRRGSG